MPSIRQNEIIGTLTKTSNLMMSLSESRLNIGAVQYYAPSLSCNIYTSGPGGLDAPVQPWKLYYMYVVVTTLGRVIQLIGSTSASGPVGYTAYRLVGYFDTNGSSLINGASSEISGNVGDIKSAHMVESEFINRNGPGWILADGRNVAGSAWATMSGTSTVPDARGMFLRGKNNGRGDGNQNPASDRALGEFEGDQMQGHVHGTNIHDDSVGGGGRSFGQMQFDNPNQIFTGGPVNDGTNGNPRVGSETRVKNITVNYFIKVN
jgi:hypothetical protein